MNLVCICVYMSVRLIVGELYERVSVNLYVSLCIHGHEIVGVLYECLSVCVCIWI